MLLRKTARADRSTIRPWEISSGNSLAGIFWHREILAIKADIASPYLKPYRLTDFEYIYGDVWHKHHRSQLTGETTDGKIEFRTAEMDNTPFMKEFLRLLKQAQK
ncbi:MAG TPA: hypothetical protein PKM58_00985 [Pyrinomonadaceae bacterium]|nr:hypothetical protein [Pyrinomonadaceae bacterium]